MTFLKRTFVILVSQAHRIQKLIFVFNNYRVRNSCCFDLKRPKLGMILTHDSDVEGAGEAGTLHIESFATVVSYRYVLFYQFYINMFIIISNFLLDHQYFFKNIIIIKLIIFFKVASLLCHYFISRFRGSSLQPTSSLIPSVILKSCKCLLFGHVNDVLV